VLTDGGSSSEINFYPITLDQVKAWRQNTAAPKFSLHWS